MDAFENGYSDYKKIKIKKINGIELEHFRSIRNRNLSLGDNITIISGKNGTMKSSLLGLIAHPFSSPNNAKDYFGNELKTDMRNVFSLSLEKDNEKYVYYIDITTTDNISFSEPVRLYPRPKEGRHRITVGKDNKSGKGNFLLNTAYINLKRLFPILDTNANLETDRTDPDCLSFVSNGYAKILQRESFLHPQPVTDGVTKNTFGPTDSYYDFKSISSGEDNIGNILNKMYAFVKNKTDDPDVLQGILCIDEVEASLHPVAQQNLFDFLLSWSIRHKIQVVITTHSLYLIQYALMKQKALQNKEAIVINMISTAFVSGNNYNIIKNPTYEEAYKELTFKNYSDVSSIYKVNVICEDAIAEYYLKRILSKRSSKECLNFIHSLSEQREGNSCTGLSALMKNGEKLLDSTIIVFDPEVDSSSIPNNSVSYIKLPSEHALPIEKTLAKYIYDLPGDSQFFIKANKERDSFINDFAQHDFLSLLNDVSILRSSNIKRFKSWFDHEPKIKQYITYYAQNNPEIINPFKETFLGLINSKLEAKGLPKIN